VVTEIVKPRIAAVQPPFEPAVQDQLQLMMPPGVPPIALFRTFVRNLPMTQAMTGWGAYELGRALSLSLREREIVIDRTCARCGCEYEWGVHVSFFAERAGLTGDQVASLTRGSPEDGCWREQRERLLILAVDSLHDQADISDELWEQLSAAFSEAALLDVLLLCGWYHAISFAARAARVPLEPGALRFGSVSSPADG
jgi:alkylhydroperoxidase family enzyme